MIRDEPVEVPQAAPARPGGIRLTERHWCQLCAHLLRDGHEHAALLICGVQAHSGGGVEFLVRSVIELTDEDYLEAGELHLSISPRSLARYAKHARSEGATLVLCHSHPFPGEVFASPVDLRTEIELCGRVFPSRLNGIPCAALILGPDGLDGRVWDGGASPLTQVTVIGSRIERRFSNACGLPNQRRAQTRNLPRNTGCTPPTAVVARTSFSGSNILQGSLRAV